MSKLQQVTRDRNWTLGRLQATKNNLNAINQVRCFTEWEHNILMTAEHLIKSILDNKQYGAKGIKIKIEAEKALASLESVGVEEQVEIEN